MATKRKAISKKTRFEVFKRDGFTCQYCGAHPPQAILHVDHIVPVAEGGGNEDTNLVTACDHCNLGKAANQCFRYFCGVCWNIVRDGSNA